MSTEIAVRYLWILPLIVAVVQCILKRKEMLQVLREHPMRIIGISIASLVLLAIITVAIIAFAPL